MLRFVLTIICSLLLFLPSCGFYQTPDVSQNRAGGGGHVESKIKDGKPSSQVSEQTPTKDDPGREELLQPLVTEFIPVKCYDADFFMDHLEAVKTTDRGVLSIDVRTNTIIMTDTPEKIAAAKKVIESVDKLTSPFIKISTIFVETRSLHHYSESFDRRPPTNANRGYPTISENQDESQSQERKILDRTNWFCLTKLHDVVLPDLEAALYAAENRNELMMARRPSVKTLSNEEVLIKHGWDILIDPVQEVGSLGSADYDSMDITLHATPRIIRNEHIFMNLSVETIWYLNASDHGKYNNSGEMGIEVNQGETIIISGITLPSSIKEETERGEFEDEREFLVFITPTIEDIEE
ncbi:hypothetical protein Dalk_2758 [Desulfatibacillum aliphaticivorans]|uniref:Uncharacterized protein n=1 Tax=Desulfatibacillum aliphaticivorans TaxID=218208 RepID=B8FKS8_DESAL|nr:secretin N-terminal domain-containing protein [Desulfatibacillum aliphaticivorans]ACL04450.1 hypothetical protein Dalk_2758 [Desulfatibacillum aliphaticivorans]